MSLYHRYGMFRLERRDLAGVSHRSLHHYDCHRCRHDQGADESDGDRKLGVGVEDGRGEPLSQARTEPRRRLDLVGRAE